MNAALVRLEPLLLATGEGATMLGCVLAVILIAALGTKDAARQHDRFMTFWIGVAFFVAYAFLGYVGFALAGIVIWRQYTTDPLQRRDHVRKAGSVVAILAALTLIGAVIKW